MINITSLHVALQWRLCLPVIPLIYIPRHRAFRPQLKIRDKMDHRPLLSSLWSWADMPCPVLGRQSQSTLHRIKMEASSPNDSNIVNFQICLFNWTRNSLPFWSLQMVCSKTWLYIDKSPSDKDVDYVSKRMKSSPKGNLCGFAELSIWRKGTVK